MTDLDRDDVTMDDDWLAGRFEANRTRLRGAAAVARGARAASARSHQSVVALVNGAPGIVFAPGGRLAVALAFAYTGDTISGIDVIADPARLDRLRLAVLD